MLWLEIVGYVGSALIAISLMMKNILKLRLINFAGAVIFAIYGLIIAAYPVFVLNVIIALVNVYYLLKIMTSKDYFQVLHVNYSSPFLKKFVNYYYNDIHKFFPEFELEKMTNTSVILILRNMIPVGFFITRPLSEDQMEILIDYIIPAYRDFKNSIFLHSEEIKKYKDVGIKTLVASTMNGMHRKYLLKMDYEQDEQDESLFRKKI